MVLEINGVCKRFGRTEALRDIRFTVDDSQLVSIIGPSGAGKTTLLRIIAGLERPDTGEVKQNSGSRAILVFQDYVLFPTMNVFENVAFGLRARHESKSSIQAKTFGILGHFGLEDKLKSYPGELSAGQKQRVAIARAMVLNPPVLLLDEPFANLDKNLKTDMAEFIRKTQKEFRTATLLVTHDQQEAFLVSDKIGVMIDGRLCQFDTVKEVYQNPVSLEAARFLGHVNVVPQELYETLRVEPVRRRDGFYARAESFTIELSESGEAIVEEVQFAGHYIVYRVSLKGWVCTVYRFQPGIQKGDRVKLRLNLD